MFLYFPQSHKGHKGVISNVGKFFVFLAALWEIPIEAAALPNYFIHFAFVPLH
jgi:hypothetical protein